MKTVSEDDLEVWWREYEKEKVQNRKWKDVSAVVNLEGLTFLSFCDIIQRLLPNRFDEVSDTLLTLFQFLDKNSDGVSPPPFSSFSFPSRLD